MRQSTVKNIAKLSRFFETDMMYVAKSGFWMNSTFIVTSIFGLISSILFARYVSKDAYGTYQFVLAVASLIAVISPNNMSSAVTRAVARGFEGDFIKGTIFQIRWGMIATLVALGMSGWYAINGNTGLSIALVLVALFVPTKLALNTWIAYIQGKKDYKRYFLYTTLSTVISYGGIFAALFLSRDFLWIAFANIFFAFLANLILFFVTIKKLPPGNKCDPETIPFGARLSIIGIPAGIVAQLDAILLFHYLGAPALAIYSFVTFIPERLTGGLKFISSIASPKFSEKSEEEVRNYLNKKIWWLLLFLGIIAGLYALATPFLFKYLFPAYISAVPYAQVYALSFFSIVAGVMQTALISQKKTKELYTLILTFPFVKAFLLIVLMFFWGVWGIIWAQIITTAFQIIFPFYLLQKKAPAPELSC